MDWSKAVTNVFVGAIGLILVVTAAVESFVKGSIDPALLVLVTAVVTTYFAGNAIRQVNGNKVDALTKSMDAIHTRMDSNGTPPANDGVVKP